MRRFAALLALLCACRSPAGGEKGALVAVQVDPGQLSQAYAPRRFALLVGAGAHSDDSWRPLRYAEKDARDLAAALAEPRYGGFDRTVVLSGPEQTTREAVLAALRELRREASRPDDVVVVYFSGHGTLARDGRAELRRYLVTSDTRFRDIVGTALPVERLKQEFELLASRRRLLVLATCHSGGGKSLLPPELERGLEGIKSGFYARPLEEASRASIVLSASDWGETAREDESLENDVYTHFLIEGLAGGADRNGDGAVSATEAHDWARRRTYEFTGGRQRPSAEILEVGADPILLAGRIERRGQPELYSYDPRLDGFTLKVDGEERAELPGGAAVKPGTRRVELTKGGSVLFEREVAVSLGQRVDLEGLVADSAPLNTLSVLGGALGFADGRSRSELLPASASLALALRRDRFLSPRLSLLVDASVGAGSPTLQLGGESVPVRQQNVALGVAIPWGLEAGRLRLGLGPRVAALWLRRSFELETYAEGQSYFTLTPGLAGLASLRLSGQLELSLQTQLMLTYVMVDGNGQLLGFTGAWAGAGYRF